MILRKAILQDKNSIWIILEAAIARRKADGSSQWQNGYPNLETIQNDIDKKIGYVLVDNEIIIAYAAILFEPEPAYEVIDGQWLTNGKYITIHRVATAPSEIGKGIATKLFRFIEDLAVQHQFFSIKVDTNFDNLPMLKIMKNLGYTYCGEVLLQGAPRMAFEKILKN